MKIPFEKVCRDYLALRGESPDLLPVLEADGENAESAVLTLRDEVAVRLLPAAFEAAMALPAIYHEELGSMESAPLAADGGKLIFRMPADYLKLHSLRMADWRETVRSVEPTDSLRFALGANAPAWMVCRERPMVKETADAGGITLEVTGSRSVAPPVQLLYVRQPVFDGLTLTISKAAYPKLLEFIMHNS